MRHTSAFLALVLVAFLCLSASVALGDDDAFLWLEETRGARALNWVGAQNALTLRAITADGDYKDTLEDAEQLLSARDRLPAGELRGGYVYNFQQDTNHPIGLWRRAPVAEYEDSVTAWEPLIDLDTFGPPPRTRWIWKGADCLPPTFARCLIKLARSGDTISVREFDVPSHSFVRGGFDFGDAPTEVAWVDANTILAATDWGAGSLTRSERPRVVKILSRGQPRSDARTVFQGEAGDVSVRPISVIDEAGRVERFVVRTIDFASAELFYVDSSGRAIRLPAPPFATFKGLHRRQLLFALTDDWKAGGRAFSRGSLVGFSLDQALAARGGLPAVGALFVPSLKAALASVAVARDAVYVTVFDNVRGRVHEVTFDGSRWAWRPVALPDAGTVEIASANAADRDVLLKYESFLTPERLYLVTGNGRAEVIKEASSRFDSFALEVAQYEAVSTDGTRVPYYHVRREGLLSSGRTPTLLYAYGGFSVSTTPWYWSAAGKLWLERGGAYAVANVRGGGEFGARWHEAARGANRQRNFDDLIAVARDMHTRGLTSPPRLGLIGDAQGGLLATGAFVQHPELFGALAAQAPLTDMLRYVYLGGGASLISEYGDPRNEQMRTVIARWSPYQNLRAGVKYPRALFMTSARDERVHPGHARKMAAKLQSLGQPALYFEQGGAPGAKQRAEQLALTYTYFRQQLMQ